MPSITARVIGESNRPFVKTMILNAGTEHGVRKGQAVADDRGLIGRIYLTGERTSWVIRLTDLSSRVPVMIETSQRRAILAGDNTPTPALDLDLAGGTATPEVAAAGRSRPLDRRWRSAARRRAGRRRRRRTAAISACRSSPHPRAIMSACSNTAFPRRRPRPATPRRPRSA